MQTTFGKNPAAASLASTASASFAVEVPAVQAHGIKERILNYLAFGTQFSQLNAIEECNPRLGEFKRISLINHINTLSNSEKWSLARPSFVKRINIIRTFVMRRLHSATSNKTFDKVKNDRDDDYSIDYARDNKPKDYIENAPASHHAAYFNFYNEDHQQLDGLIMYGDRTKAASANLPVIVLSAPRDGIYECLFGKARKIANANNVNVVLYNCRGTGLSLGKEYSTDDGIEDCRAAMEYAVTNFCNGDSKKLGVMGYSWGGGITTAGALKKYYDQTSQQIGLYINLRSFSSLNHYFQSTVLKIISKGLFKMLGINPLNTAETLTSTKLAKKTVVMRVEYDALMTDDFCLYNYLKENPSDGIELHEEGAEKDLYARRGHGQAWDYTYIGQKIDESLRN